MAGEAAAGETGAETKIESGRGCLEGRVRALERALSAERDARRKLISTLERERKTAAVAEEQVRLTGAQLALAERRLAQRDRGLWRSLLRRPPAHRSGGTSSS